MSTMTDTYLRRRDRLETYFDQTAAQTWAKLTSDAPVSKIRATVRAGRDEMRSTLLSWLPENLDGRRILDAGCGTGAFAVEAARRGAEVIAVDLSPTLLDFARDRAGSDFGTGSVTFIAGDMLDPGLGDFDHVIAMDSLIHYRPDDTVRSISKLADRVSTSIQFTFAPRTPLLAGMHAAGKLFPRSNRSPEIVPVGEKTIVRKLDAHPTMQAWAPGATYRVTTGFYISQALELKRK